MLIDQYTGDYDVASRHGAVPRVGSHVRIAETPDDRELDGFNRMLARNALTLVFVRWTPRKRINVYAVHKLTKG